LIFLTVFEPEEYDITLVFWCGRFDNEFDLFSIYVANDFEFDLFMRLEMRLVGSVMFKWLFEYEDSGGMLGWLSSWCGFPFVCDGEKGWLEDRGGVLSMMYLSGFLLLMHS
jgi:hypothetical protein